MNEAEGGPVSVVGVSMGGILARNLAHDYPDKMRRLVSIVSPTRFPTASHAEPVVRALRPFYSTSVDTSRYSNDVALPSLAVHSRDDGLIAWESCVGHGAETQSVEVEGSHVAICRNPDVLRAVASFLAPSEGVIK